jgi:uncharacterized protein YecE (DUF72 family)
MKNISTKFYSGTSGLVLPVSQVQYPPAFQGKSRLEYFAHLFNSVEINSSFYKLPKIATISKWADSVPDNFRFTFKISKTITHVKGLEFAAADVALFMQTVAHVGDKKGCLLAQFPPSVKVDRFARVQELLQCITDANKDGWKIAAEFRSPSWHDEKVYSLLDTHGVSLVIHDVPASATPLTGWDADFMYLRFHGPGGRYRGSYTDEFLKEHAAHINKWIRKGKTVYVYFNNTMGDAVGNLQTLNGLVNH